MPQNTKTPEELMEMRRGIPMCIFCEHSYYNFFRVWCKKKKDCRGLCATTCVDYCPTLQPIEERSLV